MVTATPPGEPPPAPPPTPRVAFATAARQAVLAVPGVVALDPPPPGSGRHETVPGLTVLPQAGGAHRVGVRLTAALVPLLPLAEAVRGAVHGAAFATGVPVGAVDVTVERLAAPVPEA